MKYLIFCFLVLSFIPSCRNSSGSNIEGNNDWELNWSNEFNEGSFDTQTWHRQVLTNPYNNEWQKYTGDPSTAYLEDGNLVLKASWNGISHSKGNYTSARVISNPGGQNGISGSPGKTFLYGKIAARIKLPSGKGIWPAFWMLGDNISETGGDTPWPACGEIDILETGARGNADGQYGHATLGVAMHYSDQSGNHSYKSSTNPLSSNEYHIYGIEWDEEKIVWTLDNQYIHSERITELFMSEFHKKFYVIFNIAIGGNYTDNPDSTTFPDSNSHKYMYVDWIRYYKK